MKWLMKWLCKSPLKGWGLQDTKGGFNGDIIAGKNSVVMISHTNHKHTKSTNDTWKENRVEIHKEIPKKLFKWKFDIEFFKLPPTKDWIIFSQLWNLKHANVVCLAVTNLGKGKIRINLNKKQDGVTSGLFSVDLDQREVIKVNLVADKNTVTGFINDHPVGKHNLELFTDESQHVKHGFYWSGELPFNNKSKIVAEYKL